MKWAVFCTLFAASLAAQERTDCDSYFPGSPTLVLCGDDRATAETLHPRIHSAIELDGAALVDALTSIACDIEHEDADIRRFVVDDAFSMRELAPTRSSIFSKPISISRFALRS